MLVTVLRSSAHVINLFCYLPAATKTLAHSPLDAGLNRLALSFQLAVKCNHLRDATCSLASYTTRTPLQIGEDGRTSGYQLQLAADSNLTTSTVSHCNYVAFLVDSSTLLGISSFDGFSLFLQEPLQVTFQATTTTQGKYSNVGSTSSHRNAWQPASFLFLHRYHHPLAFVEPWGPP